VTWTWENKRNVIRNRVIDIYHQRRQIGKSWNRLTMVKPVLTESSDMSTISGYGLSMWSWNHSWYSETGTIRSWDRQRTRVIVMDKTNGATTHSHHTCTYTLPVILEPHTCYKHRNYCKNSTTLFPVLLQAILFSGVAWSLLCLLSSTTAGLQAQLMVLVPSDGARSISCAFPSLWKHWHDAVRW
jgi:hypothetical protein